MPHRCHRPGILGSLGLDVNLRSKLERISPLIPLVGIELDGYDGTPPVLIINIDYSEEAHKKVELGLNKLSKDLQPMFVRFMKTLPMTQACFLSQSP